MTGNVAALSKEKKKGLCPPMEAPKAQGLRRAVTVAPAKSGETLMPGFVASKLAHVRKSVKEV